MTLKNKKQKKYSVLNTAGSGEPLVLSNLANPLVFPITFKYIHGYNKTQEVLSFSKTMTFNATLKNFITQLIDTSLKRHPKFKSTISRCNY